MPIVKSLKQKREYLEFLIGSYNQQWADHSVTGLPSHAKAWYVDVKIALQKIYRTDSAEYSHFSNLFTGPPNGSDLEKVYFFLKGRLSQFSLWEEEGSTDLVSNDSSDGRALDSTQGSIQSARDDSAKRQRIFVVHGRDQRLRTGLFTFLRSLGLQPIEFGEARKLTGKPMPYVGEILEAAFRHAQAVVVLLTPDDEARLRGDLATRTDSIYEKELTGQARPNVLFEAGMAFVTHPDQTILVQFGQLRPFSDVAGRHILHMDNSIAKRQDMAQRLETAGCLVNRDGVDWHTSGDLNPPA